MNDIFIRFDVTSPLSSFFCYRILEWNYIIPLASPFLLLCIHGFCLLFLFLTAEEEILLCYLRSLHGFSNERTILMLSIPALLLLVDTLSDGNGETCD
ncbi:hypothetical protein AVEN_68222-1 [Araneus ventricosus]|uniref:Uncharacterized protein n=1 Tax=Araneus ventricosus TaxID=182803 RepID=A0A4Y2UXG8_ARAVE|nr:hypothetical protein AVEN_68222-1 [Araneus ventricosus]